MRRFLNSLAFRIGASVLAVEVVVLVGIGFYAVDRLGTELDRGLRERVVLPGRMMARGMLSYDSVADADLMADLIGEAPEIGLIVGANGNVFHSRDPAEIGRDVRELGTVDLRWLDARAEAPRVFETRAAFSSGAGLVAVTPLFVRESGAPSLFCVVKIGTSALERMKVNLAVDVALVSLIGVAATSLIIFLVIQATALRRIRLVADFVRRIADGGTRRPRLVEGADELGALEGGVNRMVADLEQRARQRDRAERNLRESEARFRDFAASASDWYWEMDAGLRLTSLSHRCFEFIGTDRDPIGGPIEGLGVTPDAADGWGAFNRALAAREPIQDFDARREFADGRPPSFVRLSGLPVVDAKGRFAGYRGTGRDVTAEYDARDTLERRVAERTQALTRANHDLSAALETLGRTQAELARSERRASLGALVAGVAHEINTPVGVAVTAASHLADRTRETRADFETDTLRRDELAAYLETADEASRLLLANMERAARLIQSFKQVSADRAGDPARRFDLGAYLGDIVSSLSPALRDKPRRVIVECPKGVSVVGWPGQLSQVVTNLVMNSSAHAFPDGREGVITISARRRDDGWTELVHSDNGVGVRPEDMPKLFDPFFTTARGAGFTGLGLNIVHNIVTDSWNGHVEASTPPGGGIRFTLSWPPLTTESGM